MTQYELLQHHLITNQYNWLVTGVAGFIGSNLLESLLKLNQKVVGIDNFITGSRDNLEEVKKLVTTEQSCNFTFFEGDICRFSDCEKVMTKIDFVLHHAALGSVPRSIRTPELTNAINVGGFLNMIIAAKNAGIKRFVYASSSSVYGDSPDLPKREDKIGKPLSPYAVSKYTNELYAKAFANCYGIETIGLRYFNVFGPRQHPNGPYAAVIPRWTQALKKQDPVVIYGDGETSRDFCYVANAIQANLLAATTENPEALNSVFNVAIGEQHSLKQLYKLIVEALNQKNSMQPMFQEFRSGDIRHSLADINKARNQLGYSPTHTLSQGLFTMLSPNKIIA